MKNSIKNVGIYVLAFVVFVSGISTVAFPAVTAAPALTQDVRDTTSGLDSAAVQSVNPDDVVHDGQATVGLGSFLQPTEVGSLLKVFYVVVKNLKDMDYYTAREIVLPVPGIEQAIVFDFGFKGSGNLFMPLKPVVATIRSASASGFDQDSEATSFLLGLGKAFLQNELQKKAQDSAVGQWLKKFEISPTMVFGLKLMLLAKSSLTTTRVHFYPELLRLLLRLSLSQDLDKLSERALSSYLPHDVKFFVEDSFPGTLEFVDDLWRVLTAQGNAVISSVKSCSYTCLVFKTKDLAEKIAVRFASYEGDDFVKDCDLAIKMNHGQLVSYRNFLRVARIEAPTNPFVNSLVGLKKFVDFNVSGVVPEDVKAVLEKNGNTPGLLTIETSEHLHWLVYVSHKLNAFDTVKVILLNLAKAIHDYVIVKKTLLLDHKEDAQTYLKEWELSEQRTMTLQQFVESPEGVLSYKNLEQKIQKILQAQNVQESQSLEFLQSKKNESMKKLQLLVSRQGILENDIKRWTLLKAFDKPEYANALEQLQRELADLVNLIKQKELEIQDLDAEIQKVIPASSDSLEKDKHNLKALEAVANNGQQPSAQLLQTIEYLRKKISAKNAAQKMPQINIDVRLEKRAQVAQTLIDEAVAMKKELAERVEKIQRIADEEEKIIQTLLFSQQQAGYELYISNLEQEAQRILTQNKLAKELKNYKKALSLVALANISEKEQEKIKQMEEHVGYLFGTNIDDDFLANVMGKNSDVSTFFEDLNGDTAPFKEIKTSLNESLSRVLQNSEFVKKNKVIIQYFVQKYFSQFLPVFDRVLTNTVA